MENNSSWLTSSPRVSLTLGPHLHAQRADPWLHRQKFQCQSLKCTTGEMKRPENKNTCCYSSLFSWLQQLPRQPHLPKPENLQIPASNVVRRITGHRLAQALVNQQGAIKRYIGLLTSPIFLTTGGHQTHIALQPTSQAWPKRGRRFPQPDHHHLRQYPQVVIMVSGKPISFLLSTRVTYSVLTSFGDPPSLFTPLLQGWGDPYQPHQTLPLSCIFRGIPLASPSSSISLSYPFAGEGSPI